MDIIHGEFTLVLANVLYEHCLTPNDNSPCFRHEAQMAEHSADNGEGTGSNPVMPIKQVDCE